jgi:hypothetical protein
MNNYKAVFGSLSTLCLLMFAAQIAQSQDQSSQGTVQVHLVVANEAVRGDDVPTLQQSATEEVDGSD